MKICSLLPGGTEIAYALGLGDQVVGVTDLCDYPPEARAKHPVVRSLVDASALTSAEVERKMREYTEAGERTYEIDTEWLYGENPDLILTQDLCYICDVDAADVYEATAGFRIPPQVLVLSPRTVSEIFGNIRDVGEAAGVLTAADDLVRRLQARLDAVACKVAKQAHRPRVLSLEGIDPLVAGGHWIPDMRVLAGGVDDMYSPGCPAERLTWDRVVSCDPDVLVLALCSSDLTRGLREAQWLAEQEGWWDLSAVRAGQVYMIDHVYFSRPGPRVVEGIEILAQIIHPGSFTGLIPSGTVLKLDPPGSVGTRRGAGKVCAPEELARYFGPYPLP